MTTMKGSRGYRPDYHKEGDHKPAPRQQVRYSCPRGHVFEVTFSADADLTSIWECRTHGVQASIVEKNIGQPKTSQPARTHWDMLRERRSISELEDLLAERLKLLHISRGT